jgi:hypothetical protein
LLRLDGVYFACRTKRVSCTRGYEVRERFGGISDWVVGEFNSILASSLRFFRLLDHFVRPHQHVRRNRETDLLGRFQINDKLKLHRLLDRKVGRLRAF